MEFSITIDPRPKKRPKVYRWSTVNPSEEDEKELAKKFKKLPNCPKKPYTGQIRVKLTFYKRPPKNMPQWKLELIEKGIIKPNISPDLDNYVKLILDSLNGILWKDDRLIVEMHTAKYYTLGDPRVDILFNHYEPPKYKTDVQELEETSNLEEFF